MNHLLIRILQQASILSDLSLLLLSTQRIFQNGGEITKVSIKFQDWQSIKCRLGQICHSQTNDVWRPHWPSASSTRSPHLGIPASLPTPPLPRPRVYWDPRPIRHRGLVVTKQRWYLRNVSLRRRNPLKLTARPWWSMPMSRCSNITGTRCGILLLMDRCDRK